MRLRLQTTILDGKYAAKVILDEFTESEQSQQILFGKPSFNLGGRFFKEAIKGTITNIIQGADIEGLDYGATVTAHGHNLLAGYNVKFTGISGMIELNNTSKVITSITTQISGSTLVSNGSGYVNGTYANVPLINGGGASAAATIIVAGGEVESYTISNKGSNYLVDDILTVDNEDLGDSGSGFQIKVSKVEGKTFLIETDDSSFSDYISGGIAQKDPEISFNTEPLLYSVDTDKDEFTYEREFNVNADTPYPGLAAALFCTRNQQVIKSRIETWKSLSNSDLTDITETI